MLSKNYILYIFALSSYLHASEAITHIPEVSPVTFSDSTIQFKPTTDIPVLCYITSTKTYIYLLPAKISDTSISSSSIHSQNNIEAKSNQSNSTIHRSPIFNKTLIIPNPQAKFNSKNLQNPPIFINKFKNSNDLSK